MLNWQNSLRTRSRDFNTRIPETYFPENRSA
jgi:hypothetical protein